MKRLLLFIITLAVFVAIIAWATRTAAPSRSDRNLTGDNLAQLIALVESTNMPPEQLDQGQPVIFPDSAGTAVAHAFFPLTDGHGSVCAACHENGTYEGTDPTCYACHAADDAHDSENGLDCITCHTPTIWQDAQFDHGRIGTQECVECHQPPENHYQGQCSRCHIDTTTFINVRFDHSFIDSQDCSACHIPPANHFPAPCAACHIDTNDFLILRFDHSFIGGQDCVACHTPPVNHFPAPCAACHIDTNDFNIIFLITP